MFNNLIMKIVVTSYHTTGLFFIDLDEGAAIRFIRSIKGFVSKALCIN